VAALIAPSIAAAHEDAGVAGGFLSGFTHPLFGWDHVAAMVAVDRNILRPHHAMELGSTGCAHRRWRHRARRRGVPIA
jgi:hypothetical protein